MTGMTEADYRDMMLAGGRSIEGNRIADQVRDAAPRVGRGRVYPGCTRRSPRAVFTSHVPGDRRGDGPRQDRGAVLEEGLRRLRVTPSSGRRRTLPDVIILVYNDHATAFDLSHHPDLRRSARARTTPSADEGYGPRPVPGDRGRPRARRAHRALPDPRRLRPHPGQRDGRRPRTDRPADADVRRRRAVALQGHPVPRQRRAVPGPVGPAVLRAGAGPPPGRRVPTTGR